MIPVPSFKKLKDFVNKYNYTLTKSALALIAAAGITGIGMCVSKNAYKTDMFELEFRKFYFQNYVTPRDHIDSNGVNTILLNKSASIIIPQIQGYTEHNINISRNYTIARTIIVNPAHERFEWHFVENKYVKTPIIVPDEKKWVWDFVKETYNLTNNRDIANKVNEVANFNYKYNIKQQPNALVDTNGDGIKFDVLPSGKKLMLPIQESDTVSITYYTDSNNKTYVKESPGFREVTKRDLERIIKNQAKKGMTGKYGEPTYTYTSDTSDYTTFDNSTSGKVSENYIHASQDFVKLKILDTYMNNSVNETVSNLGITRYRLYKTLNESFDGFRKSAV